MKFKSLQKCVREICLGNISIEDVEEVEHGTIDGVMPDGNSWVFLIDVFCKSYWANLDRTLAYDTVLDLLHFKKINVVKDPG